MQKKTSGRPNSGRGNTGRGKGNGGLAFMHIGAMLAGLFGASMLVMIAALLGSLFIGKKGSITNNQVREIARLQTIVTFLSLAVGTVFLVLMSESAAPVLLLVMMPISIYAMVMPIVAAIRVSGGYDYAYPLTRSPRRQA